jgi:two-component system chemotaxis response regulator CheB
MAPIAGTPRRAPVRVLLVDDSAVALTFLKRLIESSGEVTVVGTARNGVTALELLPELDPDVVCTDLHMPDMDGLELTRRILAEYPKPVLVISASTQPEDSHNVFLLLEAGAIDVMPKPVRSDDAGYEAIGRELVSKIKVLAGVYVFRRKAPSTAHGPASTAAVKPAAGRSTPRIVVIGASTGGPQVLKDILGQLPADYTLPIICVQHISSEFLEGFVDWLGRQCAVDVRLAEPGEIPRPGHVYLPRADRHLEIGADGRFLESIRPSVDGHRPSVTVAMISASRYYGAGTVGVLLSGMGRDGADGLLAIASAGGTTIAQDESSSTVFGMPKQAIELGAAQFVMSPGAIVRRLLQLAPMR